jgi:selenide, water dikinase
MGGMSTTGTPKLTALTTCGGCAAKWGASLLGELVSAAQVPGPEDGVGGGDGGASEGGGDVLGGSAETRMLVGLAPSDDAAVVQVADDVALVTTTDFFPPLVDDPGDYGAIAAANACSDVFAMGGDVVVALNVAAFPETLPTDVIRAIFAAAAEVVREAGGVVAGGHTIRSPEPIFGLAVQGVVRPGDQLTKGGARPGDVLVLSKPLGTGLALASGDDAVVAAAVRSMRALNRDAAAALRAARDTGGGVHAVTDVTGFGLLGHGWEVSERSDGHLVFDASALPLIDGVAGVAAAGVRTGGDARNRDYVADRVALAADEAAAAVGFDPQTSGGLLAAVEPSLVDGLAPAGFVPVGEVTAAPPGVTLL